MVPIIEMFSKINWQFGYHILVEISEMRDVQAERLEVICVVIFSDIYHCLHKN